MAVEGEVLLGDGEPDERHRVHLGDQLHRVQDADHREPVPADPHLGRVGEVVDAEQVAASAPRTTAGKWAVAAFKKVPWAMVAPSVAGRAASVAVSEMPFVLMAGTNELR